MRAFVAIELPEELREYFQRVQDVLTKRLHGAKWTRPEGIHLTLKFLGDVEPGSLEDIKGALSRACAGAGCCELTTSSLGVFPGLRAARVLWAGCEDTGRNTAALQGRIDAALTPLGFEPEKRAFKPHLTLARFRTPAHIQPDAISLRMDMLTFRAVEVVLFRSELKPGGAVYTKLETFSLL